MDPNDVDLAREHHAAFQAEVAQGREAQRAAAARRWQRRAARLSDRAQRVNDRANRAAARARLALARAM
jgi:hypothetical protein